MLNYSSVVQNLTCEQIFNYFCVSFITAEGNIAPSEWMERAPSYHCMELSICVQILVFTSLVFVLLCDSEKLTLKSDLKTRIHVFGNKYLDNIM